MTLFSAVAKNDPVAISELIQAGADPNIVSVPYGNTPLYSACFADNVTAIRALLAAGADPNFRMTYRSPVDGRVEAGLVALMVCRSVDAVDALITAGAVPTVANSTGDTPLMRAALAAGPAAVARLLAAGADRDAKDASGRTAADHVRARLEWLNESWDHLKQPAATRRRQQLEEVLAILRCDDR